VVLRFVQPKAVTIFELNPPGLAAEIHDHEVQGTLS
jgi:hypothetical protein